MWGGGVYHAGAEHGGGEGGLCAEAELDTLILASSGHASGSCVIQESLSAERGGEEVP